MRFISTIVLLITLVLTGACSVAGSFGTGVVNVSPQEASDLIRNKASSGDLTVIDVRTVQEYAAGHLANAINIDVGSPAFREQVGRLDRRGVYLLYCLTGIRSRNAADIMLGLGFTTIYNLTSGIGGWEAAGLPVTR